MSKACSVSGCERKYYGVGLCEMHYQRKRLTGTTDAGPKGHASLKDRLERNSQKDGSCVVWRGGKTKAGYGRIQSAGKGSITVSVHRAAYEIAHGKIPEGLVVMHSCDNRLCINPEHLSVGTHADNTADMVKKGRFGARPDIDYSVKLTENDVREIRNSSESVVKMAKRLGVSISAVQQARTGKTWAHVK